MVEECFAGAVAVEWVFVEDWLEVHRLSEGAGFDVVLFHFFAEIFAGVAGLFWVDYDAAEPFVRFEICCWVILE